MVRASGSSVPARSMWWMMRSPAGHPRRARSRASGQVGDVASNATARRRRPTASPKASRCGSEARASSCISCCRRCVRVGKPARSGAASRPSPIQRCSSLAAVAVASSLIERRAVGEPAAQLRERRAAMEPAQGRHLEQRHAANVHHEILPPTRNRTLSTGTSPAGSSPERSRTVSRRASGQQLQGSGPARCAAQIRIRCERRERVASSSGSSIASNASTIAHSSCTSWPATTVPRARRGR